MSYQIIITEKHSVVRTEGKEWKVIDTVEVQRECSIYDSSEEKKQTRIKEVMGYTPEIQVTVVEEREIYRQTVDKLNLVTVIRAVNSL